jgi:hypothetical protein
MKYNPIAKNIKIQPKCQKYKIQTQNAKNIIITQHSRTHLRCEVRSGEIQNECPRRIPHHLMEWRLAVTPHWLHSQAE